MNALSTPVGVPASAAAGERVRPRLDLRVGVASISRDGRDGVAYVTRLVERAASELSARLPATFALERSEGESAGALDRALFAVRLASAQLAGSVDALLFTHLGPARVQGLVPAVARVPYGVFLHGIEVTRQRMTDDRLRVLRGATLRVANSQFTARRIASELPEIGPVHACPLALLPEAALDEHADAGLVARVAGAESALIVGRMSSAERYKGHDQLIDAWPAVLAERPEARLFVVGGGDDEQRLRRKAASAGLGEAVVFCGRVSDATLAGVLRAARLLAMPSAGEGFGLVYLEAMRAGLPCIASPDDGGADVVVDGETGFLVPQSDLRALARAVASLLADPARARELGAAGRARYERHFTFERFRDRFGSLIADAFATNRGGS